eukprot:4937447-Amphidinium_carterae.1
MHRETVYRKFDVWQGLSRLQGRWEKYEGKEYTDEQKTSATTSQLTEGRNGKGYRGKGKVIGHRPTTQK